MLSLQRVTLIGLSLGARTALDFSLVYPEPVQKLVLVSPSISGYTFLDEWVHKHYAEMFKALSQKDLVGAVEEQFEMVQAKLAHNHSFARRNNTSH